MNFIAEIIVVIFALTLFGVTAVVFVRPITAERFFNAFASSARTHYTEQIIRLLVGASIIMASPNMWQSRFFSFVGWMIALSSLLLIVAPWRWHHRFGERIRPTFMRYIKLYGLGAFAFGVLLLYGVVATPNNVA